MGARSHRGSGTHATPVAAVIGWLVVVAGLLVLVEYWRWVALGVTVLGGLAVLGVLLEWLAERRNGVTRHPGPPGA